MYYDTFIWLGGVERSHPHQRIETPLCQTRFISALSKAKVVFWFAKVSACRRGQGSGRRHKNPPGHS
eukprot:scaffold3410_cov158-Amphora_coffeaeformis.AAC.14